MTRSTRARALLPLALRYAYLLLLTTTLPGCATHLGAGFAGSQGFDDMAAPSPPAAPGKAVRGTGIRRAAGASQVAATSPRFQ